MPVTIGNLRSTWSNSTILQTGIGLNVNTLTWNPANTYLSNNASIIKLTLNDEIKFKLSTNGDLHLTGGDLRVNGNVFSNGQIYLTNDVYANDDLYISGNTFANSRLYVTGNVFANGGIYASNTIFANDKLYVTGNVFANGGIYASNTIFANAGIFVTSNISLFSNGDIFVTGNVFSNTISIKIAYEHANAAYAKANSALPNSTTVLNGTLTVTQNVVTSNLIISGGIQPTVNNSYGSSGQVLTSNGTSVYWSNPPAVNVQTFDVSGTWSKPISGSMIRIQLWGGGGSGRASQRFGPNWLSVVGGGGGGYREYVYPLSDFNDSETVTIGAGGLAVTGNTDGNQGGTTTFSTLNGAGGGQGGKGARSTLSTTATVLSKGGDYDDFRTLAPHFTGSDGSIVYLPTGCCTVLTYANSSNVFYGGGGGGGLYNLSTNYNNNRLARPGTSILGGSGGAASNGANGVAGTIPGGGGGAAWSGNTYVVTSGAGANGRAIITVW